MVYKCYQILSKKVMKKMHFNLAILVVKFQIYKQVKWVVIYL